MATRREQILETAAELFAARGFHGVSVADLGAACGISGPALYKHFPSKDSMLAEMLVNISEHLLDGGQKRVANATDPRSALQDLIDFHVDFAITHPALIAVQERDWSSLPDDSRSEVRHLQRDYVSLWAEQVTARYPAVTGEAARATAHVGFGLINSTPHSKKLPIEAMREILTRMARLSLGVD